MGKPENSTPPRPPSVPPDARWDPKQPGFEWIAGELDDQGRRHGTFRSWTRDGFLHGETDYDHGRVHGKNRNFHPDHTIASEADWVAGVIMDSAFFRSASPTPEPFVACGANVWCVRYYTRDGKTNFTIRYFTQDGSECGPDGKPLPIRARGVPNTARWFPEMDRWVDGAIERGTSLQVGRWRWWSRDGVLLREEIRDGRGEPNLISEHDATGTLKKRIARTPDGEQRDYHLHDGKLSSRHRDDADGREIYKASWDRDGVMLEEIVRTYAGDELHSVVERGIASALAFEARREGPSLACMLYADDGETLAATGLVRDGKLADTWRIFDDMGAVRREVDTTPLAIEHAVTGRGLIWQLGRALFETDGHGLDSPAELAGVEDEAWDTTPGAYDHDVERFPALLRALVAPDPLVRRFALRAIGNEIEHQGSTYPATARVIPYLARLLAHPAADRSSLLQTIRSAAEAALPYVDQVRDLDADDEYRVAIVGTVDAAIAAWPMIFGMFPAASPPDRQRILALAKHVPAARTSIVEVSQRDPDPAMRACAVEHLTQRDDVELADTLPCLADRDPLVRAAAAIAIGRNNGASSPRDVIVALADSIRNWREIATRFSELPYTDGHVLASLAVATGSIRTPDARSLAQALCAAFDEVDARSATTYGHGLLSLAFGRGERPFAKRFVEILDTLARSAKFWSFDLDAKDVLATWNLPGERHSLAALVRELQTANDPESVAMAKLGARA